MLIIIKQKQIYLKLLLGHYSALPSSGGANDIILMSELMSDECFGGGGSGDITFHDLDGFYQQRRKQLHWIMDRIL